MGPCRKALKLRSKGYNCAQCVLLSCSDIDKELASSIASGFGGGAMSGEMCGAISGGIMVLGLNKASHSAVKEYVNCFKEKFGCVRCFDLKSNGVSCKEMIKFAVDTAEIIMEKNNGNL